MSCCTGADVTGWTTGSCNITEIKLLGCGPWIVGNLKITILGLSTFATLKSQSKIGGPILKIFNLLHLWTYYKITLKNEKKKKIEKRLLCTIDITI